MQFERRSEKVRFATLVGLLSACFLMGGASRLDVTSLMLLQPLSALCVVAFLLTPGKFDWRPMRIPLLLLAAVAGIMVVQLIPLPPSVWTQLPGRDPFAQTAIVAGISQPWRPISLTPDLTLASLVGLIVPFGILIGLAAVERHRRQTLLAVILIGTAVSALFALAQVSSGANGPFYLYRITNQGNGVGLFSNRNHQGVLLAMAWPMLAVWATIRHGDFQREAAVRWIAAACAVFLLPLLLVTGSRAGLVLGIIALGCAAIIWRARARSMSAAGTGGNRLFLLAAGAAAVIVVVTTVMLSRAEAIQRMLAPDSSGGTRTEAMPVLLNMASDFFPIGAGFGSFDPVYRLYEPSALLSPQYLNHAHNDLLELIITGGLPGVVVALLFVGWLTRQSVRAWRSSVPSLDVALARAGSVMVVLVLLSSLVDYPLRTSLMMAIVAIACGWLGVSDVLEPSDSCAPDGKSTLLPRRL